MTVIVLFQSLKTNGVKVGESLVNIRMKRLEAARHGSSSLRSQHNIAAHKITLVGSIFTNRSRRKLSSIGELVTAGFCQGRSDLNASCVKDGRSGGNKDFIQIWSFGRQKEIPTSSESEVNVCEVVEAIRKS
jgi:hypothetical protein